MNKICCWLLRRGFEATSLLGYWFRIPPGAWMSVSWECCVLSGRGLCDWLITHPGKSYRVWSWSLDNEETLAHYGFLHHRSRGSRRKGIRQEIQNFTSYLITNICAQTFPVRILLRQNNVHHKLTDWLTPVCCVLSGTGLCDGPILLPEESYPVHVCVCITDGVITWG